MERRILLKKALDILLEIDTKMKEHDGVSECPFCMGELFYSEEWKVINDIKEYLKEK